MIRFEGYFDDEYCSLACRRVVRNRADQIARYFAGQGCKAQVASLVRCLQAIKYTVLYMYLVWNIPGSTFLQG